MKPASCWHYVRMNQDYLIRTWLHPLLLGLNDNGVTKITSASWGDARPVTPAAIGPNVSCRTGSPRLSTERVFCWKSRDSGVEFQIITKRVERPHGSVMCKVPCQGQAHSRIVRAQSDVIKLWSFNSSTLSFNPSRAVISLSLIVSWKWRCNQADLRM